MSATDSIRWRRLTVRGRVQGVGFRPAVWRHARALGLSGTVRNTAREVIIEIGGPAARVAEFERTLAAHLPPQARIESLAGADIPPRGLGTFEIAPSEPGAEAEPTISPDLAVCADCLRELRDPRDRRHGYPFLACTQCGPRYSVVESMPYDREHTTLRHFPLCPDCLREYRDSPADRRFHAEATACPRCGPTLVWAGERGDSGQVNTPTGQPTDQSPGALLLRTVDLLRKGHILAIKGVGGYHLACDAANAAAVATLRRRKGRPHKPFALMMASLDVVRRHCHVDASEAALLTSPEAPIVLLRRRADSPLPTVLAPGNGRLGVMLPHAPLHHLLMDHFEALVMTSGNLSDEPLVSREDELGRLVPAIADAALAHNRPIANACDDSIAAVLCEHPVVLRRARGFVPTPITIPHSSVPRHEILCLGSDLKSTFALVRGDQVYLSPHLGDLQSALNAERAQATVARWCEWLGIDPAVVVHDLHPHMVSTAAALRRPAQERLAVQHHHAHLAACLAEHGVAPPALGVIWDGTGYGLDHTVWGGEFLLAWPDGTFERVAHLEPVPLPGGDLAIRQPWRMACAHLTALLGADRAREVLAPLRPGWERALAEIGDWREEPGASEMAGGATEEMFGALVHLLARRPDRFVATSSAGRLFDTVGVLAGLGPAVSFEGQHAIALEALAADAEAEPWPFEVKGAPQQSCGATGVGNRPATALSPPLLIRLGPMFEALLADRAEGASPGLLAARFHATLAEMIAEVVCAARARCGNLPVALSGGCFQNARLLGGVVAALRRRGIEPLHHRRVPPNDGGIAFGQAVVAAQRLTTQGRCPRRS